MCEEGVSMKGLEIGQKAEVRRVFTRQDVIEYESLTGNTNLRFGHGNGAKAGCEKEVVAGPLLGGMFSYLLGTKLPGPGTMWLKERLKFQAPAYVGEEITAVVEIIRLRPEKQLVNLRTHCTNSTGQVICEGEALVLVESLQPDVSSGGTK
jgi:acyl dehydratase